ncbi:flagellar basal body L-ring protein FlgH [Rhizobium sp. KVB221]|uniref:Flagellar L-ring protein n=1 Tax=Rhizobium setariae TaxID=2801340 RepID=A0A936YQ12_9HYPH|nr:flagellar basal body L-ring protein FlgH [Rhizobium setariae]MBL0370681.1 flagellar basal body L-ring protein FlgH [Rhizobium setariae]
MKTKLTALTTVLLLASCSQQAVKEIGKAPVMSPIGTGLQYTQTSQMSLYPKQPAQTSTGYSLWSDQKAALFKDARAYEIGDILTVIIDIDDQAKFDNTTDRSRESNWSKNFGLNGDDSHNSVGLSADIEQGSKTSTKGDGSIERKEKLTLQVAVVVTGKLDNGNVLISGSQEVRVNQELRVLNLAGIARPLDVDANNKISYEKIAEARISYGGRGRLSEVQNAPVGQQFLDIFSPL